MKSAQIIIMPCATIRAVQFQLSSTYICTIQKLNLQKMPWIGVLNSYSKAKCCSTKWQHSNGGAWLKERASVEAAADV
jgi:hypothetical protein